MKEYELIVSIFNRGYSSTAMEAAKKAGARGGTVLNTRGTGSHEVEKFFGITIQPEKEMLLILVDKEVRNAVMQAIGSVVGLHTAGQGILFSLPVQDVLGLSQETGLKEDSAPID